jgi:hypothetical protein
MHIQSQNDISNVIHLTGDYNKENIGSLAKPVRFKKKTSIPITSFVSEESTDSTSPNR